MEDDRQTISVTRAERAVLFQGGRALCFTLAAVIATAEIILGGDLPDRSHGLMFVIILLLVSYASSSWHADRALIRARRERILAEAGIRILLNDLMVKLDELQLAEVLAETRATRAQGEERTVEMRKIEERVTRLVEVAIARLGELVDTVRLKGQAMATMHDDLDKLSGRVAAVGTGITDGLSEVRQLFGQLTHRVEQLAHRVEQAEASTAGWDQKLTDLRDELTSQIGVALVDGLRAEGKVVALKPRTAQ